MPNHGSELTRRSLLAASGIALAGSGLAATARGAAPVPEDYQIEHGHIRHSVMGWCFRPMTTKDLAVHCKRMGMQAMEGISPGDTVVYRYTRKSFARYFYKEQERRAWLESTNHFSQTIPAGRT